MGVIYLQNNPSFLEALGQGLFGAVSKQYQTAMDNQNTLKMYQTIDNATLNTMDKINPQTSPEAKNALKYNQDVRDASNNIAMANPKMPSTDQGPLNSINAGNIRPVNKLDKSGILNGYAPTTNFNDPSIKNTEFAQSLKDVENNSVYPKQNLSTNYPGLIPPNMLENQQPGILHLLNQAKPQTMQGLLSNYAAQGTQQPSNPYSFEPGQGLLGLQIGQPQPPSAPVQPNNINGSPDKQVAANKEVQKYFPNWQPDSYVYGNPNNYKSDMQAATDQFWKSKGAGDKNAYANLVSNLSNISKAYWNQPDLANSVAYTINQVGGNKNDINTILSNAQPIKQQNALPTPQYTVTPQEASQQIKYKIMPQVMKQLADQGVDIKSAMPYLQQAMQDHLAVYTDNYNQGKINELTQVFNDPNATVYQKATAVMQMNKYGAKIDPSLLQALSPDWRLTLVPQGNQITIMAADSKSGKTANLGAMPVNASPNVVAQLQEKRYEHNNPSGNTLVNAQNQFDIARLRSASAERIAQAKASAARNNGKVNGISIDQYEKASTRYNAILEDIWNSSTPEERTMKKNSYKNELNYLGQALGVDVQNDVDYIK